MYPFLKQVRTVFVLCIFVLLQSLTAQNIFINEFMASNSKTITDPQYKLYGDWIELYNAGPVGVNLKGYSITDLLSQPGKYRFTTDIIVQPDSFLLIWADDSTVGTHTNFKLSASGESIGLFDPSGVVVDSVTFGAQQTDISTGRFPNGGAQWFTFSPSSPGAANSESGISNKLPLPILSHSAGFYPGSISVTLSHPTAGTILHYTIDGHTPTDQSTQYTSTIPIDTTTVLRVKAFKTGFLPSNTMTATFFINEQTNLPVFSLTTDPENFFSDTSGIYVAGTNGIIDNCSTAPRNWNQDWECIVELEFFEKEKQLAFKVTAGVKIFGGCTRLYPEKSLAFYFRGNYGFDKLKYRLFPDRLISEYNNFVLRSSGQDWWRTMFRDGMVQTLVEQGMKIDYQDYRPAVLFINGQYWGIHNIREKLNEHYVESHFNIDGNTIDIVEISKDVAANNGDLVAYNSMIDFITANNLALPGNYQYIKSIVDIDEYIDYQIAQIYSANGDWPGSNMKLWRERKPEAKWRWMIYDLDFTFGGNAQGQYNTNTLAQATATNGPQWPNPPWSTLMLRKLLENAEFKNEFIQRFAAHLNTTYEKNHVVSVIDSLAQGIAAEIPRHKIRWPQSISLDKNNWEGNTQIMKDFATSRPAAAIGHFTSKFSIGGINTLVISRNDPSQGKVFTNSIEVTKNGFSNIFFRNIPLRIKAQALPGFRFVKWEGIISSTKPETTFVFASNSTLTALFEPASLTVTNPVINEINYKSTAIFDTEDWVELYNPSPEPVDLTGWTFGRGIETDFVFPAGSTLHARDYTVISRDTTKFRSLRPETKNLYGNMNFGLSSSGERIQLFNVSKVIIDDVQYLPTAPWATEPNGTGPTLSLVDPQRDNAQPENWKASKLYGTPGALNDVYTITTVKGEQHPDEYRLYQNYPNPFNPSTTIAFRLKQRGMVTLTVYNQLGQSIRQLVNAVMEDGYHEVHFNAGEFASGMYFYELKTPSFRKIKKLIFLK